MKPLLSIEHLSVAFHTWAGTVRAVRDICFELNEGEIIGLVGESGCGKSVTANAIMGLIPSPPGHITNGRILFAGQDINQMSSHELRRLRGSSISMIFQDPMSSLNPVLTIGLQIAEMYQTHQGLSRKAALEQSVHMLRLVGIPAPETRLHQYPHELSGGMRQRVMIAMALALHPRILIADEPTTALDVTVQAQIIDLMKQLNQELATSILLISHDLGVIAGLCSRVLIMYAGEIVEAGLVGELYQRPQHPYTQGLLSSLPRLNQSGTRLQAISGQPPDLIDLPPGCAFLPRCAQAMACCQQSPPIVKASETHFSSCWLQGGNSL